MLPPHFNSLVPCHLLTSNHRIIHQTRTMKTRHFKCMVHRRPLHLSQLTIQTMLLLRRNCMDQWHRQTLCRRQTLPTLIMRIRHFRCMALRHHPRLCQLTILTTQHHRISSMDRSFLCRHYRRSKYVFGSLHNCLRVGSD